MMRPIDKQAASGVINFIQSNDRSLDTLAEIAVLTAFGIPFSSNGSHELTGDLGLGFHLNWTFERESLDGKYSAAQLLGSIRDGEKLADPANMAPEAVAAAALQNLVTLIRFYIGHLPRIEVIKRGGKTLILPEGVPLRDGELLIRRLSRN